MKNACAILSALALAAAAPAAAQVEAPGKMIGYIPLPGIEGWFDHMSFDVKSRHLFLPAEHKQAIEVIDVRTGKILREVTGFQGNPRRSVFIPQSSQFWVDDGESVKSFNWKTYTLTKTIPLQIDKASQQIPDNGAYDAVTGLFYVCITADANAATATAKGRVDIVDTRKGALVGSVAIDDADPGGIAFDAATSRMFVILGGDARVQVVDRKTRTTVATWPIANGLHPHSVTIDTAHHRLFVGSRGTPSHIFKPGKLFVIDTDSGKVAAALDTQGGPDELWYDGRNARVYVTGTTGGVDVFKQLDADHYRRLGELVTAADAKTSMFVPELKRLYVAVPKRSVAIPLTRDVIVEDAKLLVFETP